MEEYKTDPLYSDAVELVSTNKKASVSFLQRALKIGYNRAARLIEGMEEEKIISLIDASGARQVLKPTGDRKRMAIEEPSIAYLSVSAEQHIGKDLLAAMIDELKSAPNSWQKLTKDQQDDVIDRLKRRIAVNITAAVSIIAAKDRPTLTGHVKKVTFADSGVEGQIVLSKNQPGRHDLSDSQGEDVLIVITNPKEFTQTMDDIEGEQEQRTIF